MDIEYDAFIIESCMLCVYMVVLMNECMYVRVNDDDNDNECSLMQYMRTHAPIMFSVCLYLQMLCDVYVMVCDGVLIENGDR